MIWSVQAESIAGPPNGCQAGMLSNISTGRPSTATASSVLRASSLSPGKTARGSSRPVVIRSPGLLGLAVLLDSPWFAMLSLPVALVGLAVAVAGRAALPRYGPVAALLG